MKITLYVHDFKLEVGHSNSLIELIRHLPKDYLKTVSEIRIVSYTAAELKTLFPGFEGKLTWSAVPFPRIRPVLFKSIFYQLWTYVYNKIYTDKSFLKIGIGISSLDVDVVSIQFIHSQWNKRGIEIENGRGGKKIYKKILFKYFEICENYLLNKRDIKFFSPAKFLTKFLKGKNDQLITSTIYSGVNLSRFQIKEISRIDLIKDLKVKHTCLRELDLDMPIHLFVGAYERKGLVEALKILKENEKNPQFIVIGMPSTGNSIIWPKEIKIFQIPYTNEVSKFYSLSDTFIFPTMYEPFGLVLFEAMAMGLTIITRKLEVGASELLDGLPEVYYIDGEHFEFPAIRVKSYEDKLKLREERLRIMGDVSWTKAGNELATFLQSDK